MWYSRGYDTPEDEDEARAYARRARQASQLAQVKALDPELDVELSDFDADEAPDAEEDL